MSPEDSGVKRIDIYELGALLGHGGMASVYQAVLAEDRPDLDLKVGDEVALKILHAHLAATPEFLRRFGREAKVAAKLRHPNIARVLDQGQAPDGRPYLVMELARGIKLGDLLKNGEPLSTDLVFRVLRQVAEVLEEARRAGIIHRDIKPDNLVLEDGERVRVLDFGLVRDDQMMSMVSQAMSMTGKSIGTPAYMSPEQCRGGHEIDHRSDLYSLGVTAYHMATGRAPFVGPTPTAFIHQHETEIPEPIEKSNPACPRPLAAVITRLMAKDPKDRYLTAAELLEDLSKAEAGRMPTRIYRFRKVRRYTPRRVAALVIGAVVVMAAAAVAAYFLATDAARTEIRQAESQARQAAEAGNYTRAVEILNATIAKHARRGELLGPLESLREQYVTHAAAEQKERQARLVQVYEQRFQEGLSALKEKRYDDALGAFEWAQKKQETAEVRLQIEGARARRDQVAAAQVLLADVRAALAAGDLRRAAELAERGIRDFADTEEAKALADLRVQAESRLATTATERQDRARDLETQGTEYEKSGDLRAALSSWQSALELAKDPALERRVALLANKLARYDAALAEGKRVLDEGRAGRDKAKCLEALRRFEEAHGLWASGEVDRLGAEAQAAADAVKERIAVVDFQVQGDVGVADAGKIIPRLLLSEFAEKYELVTRTQLESLLREKNLQISDLMAADRAAELGKLLPVRYLVVGEVMKGADFWITAQLVEVGPGIIRSPRKVGAPTY
ncbi:MAG TPA: protein kinase, partial [Phycisphaerae bacterium]|nr:protein kinase [Phycisphaerae bacterium]